MPFSGDLPHNPTALRKMIVDLGITPDVSGHPNAYRKQLLNHYDAQDVAVPVQPTVPQSPVHVPSRPIAVSSAVPQPTVPQSPVHVPSRPIAVPVQPPVPPAHVRRTVEGVAEENRKLVASHQGNLNNELAYINSVWTPSYSDGYYWISKNATDHLPGWGYGGYIPPYDKWPSNWYHVPQSEFDQMSWAVNNYVGGRRNYYQNAIDASDSKAQAEIKEIQRNRLSVSVSPVISVNPAVQRTAPTAPVSQGELRNLRTSSSAPIPVSQGDFMRGILNKEIRNPNEGVDNFSYVLKNRESVYDQDLLRGIFRRKDGQ